MVQHGWLDRLTTWTRPGTLTLFTAAASTPAGPTVGQTPPSRAEPSRPPARLLLLLVVDRSAERAPVGPASPCTGASWYGCQLSLSSFTVAVYCRPFDLWTGWREWVCSTDQHVQDCLYLPSSLTIRSIADADPCS